jgi:hypothetical protein
MIKSWNGEKEADRQTDRLLISGSNKIAHNLVTSAKGPNELSLHTSVALNEVFAESEGKIFHDKIQTPQAYYLIVTPSSISNLNYN